MWVVHEKGKQDDASWELSVIRQEFQHGFRSYGWFSEGQKICVWSSGGPCRYVPHASLVGDYRAMAQKLADELNSKPMKPYDDRMDKIKDKKLKELGEYYRAAAFEHLFGENQQEKGR